MTIYHEIWLDSRWTLIIKGNGWKGLETAKIVQQLETETDLSRPDWLQISRLLFPSNFCIWQIILLQNPRSAIYFEGELWPEICWLCCKLSLSLYHHNIVVVFCDFHSSLQNRPSWGAAAVLKSFSRLFRLWRIRRERLQKRRRAGPSTKVFYFALVPLSIMSKVDAINFQHGKQILSFFSPSKLISCSIAKLKAGWEQRCLFLHPGGSNAYRICFSMHRKLGSVAWRWWQSCCFWKKKPYAPLQVPFSAYTA